MPPAAPRGEDKQYSWAAAVEEAVNRAIEQVLEQAVERCVVAEGDNRERAVLDRNPGGG